MKNNTKLIIETWRRFINEMPEGVDEYGMVEEEEEMMPPEDMPPLEDAQMSEPGYSSKMSKKEMSDALEALYGKLVQQGFTQEQIMSELDEIAEHYESGEISDEEVIDRAYPDFDSDVDFANDESDF
tara:strand:+ start:324 stop:704 length:381 start_codon:yes stop_codon:yes gene_type:complete